MIAIALRFALVLGLLAAADSADTCGQKQAIAQQFIWNGYKALAGAWPWHGALFIRNRGSVQYACGVTILTKWYVITAAHCTIDHKENKRLPAKRVFIKVGLSNLEATEIYAQQHDIDKIIRHEGYTDKTFENDIALMKLYTEITMSSAVQPICLWQGDSSLSKIIDKVGYIVGWGYDENFEQSLDLNEATAPIVSKFDCFESDPVHFSKFYHDSKTFCAGYTNGTAIGLGSSGGGLYLQDGGRWVLRGILSNGKLDPDTNTLTSYQVFTDVAYYLDWIRHFVSHPSKQTSDSSVIEFFK